MNVMGWDRRDPPRANHYWDEAITIYRDLGDWRNLAFLLGVYGDTLLAEGDLEAAEPFLREAEEFNQRLKDDRGMEFVLVARSRQALLARDFAQARACLEQWLSIVEGTGNRMGYLWGRARLGYVALLEGSLEEGSRHLREAAREFHRDHNKVGLAFTLEKMAYLFTLSGLSERALRLLGWADHTRAETGDIRPVLEQVDVDRDIAACRSRLGAEAAEAAMDEGRRMSFDEAFALPLQDH